MKSVGRRLSRSLGSIRSNLVVWSGVGVMALLLGLMGVGMVVSHRNSEDRLIANFDDRGEASAGFIGTFISHQAQSERASAERFLSARRGFVPEFDRTVVRFGSTAAVLLDDRGRLLAAAPNDPTIIGKEVGSKYPHLRRAERGQIAVSGVVSSAVKGEPVIGIAVPYSTSSGRRVFSVAYQASSTLLASFIDRTSLLKGHQVLLVDSEGNVIAGSPRSGAATLAKASPALAESVARSPDGSVTIDGEASTYLTQPVPGTPWRLIVAVPDDELFASIGGATE